jgi:hypothetical protein
MANTPWCVAPGKSGTGVVDLGAPDCGHRQVLVHAGAEDDALRRQHRGGGMGLDVHRAERRAAIAGEKPRRVQPRGRIAPALRQQQADQRLGSGQDHPSGAGAVADVEHGVGGLHAEFPPPGLCAGLFIRRELCAA